MRLADLFPSILFSASVSVISAPAFIWLSKRMGLIDRPGTAPHKAHSLPTPMAGGMILAASIGAVYLLLQPPVGGGLAGVLLGGAWVLLWGVLDDRFDLHPVVKLAAQAGATAILVLGGIQVLVTRVPWLDLAITALWVVGLTNAFNFVDSMDGLALGLGAIAAAFFMLVTMDAAQPELAYISAAILGGAIGAFLYNAHPAKTFLGDSGAQLLGFLLSAVGIAYIPAQAGLPQELTWFTPILVMGVPIFDMVLVVYSRWRRGRPVFAAGTDHTYHRLHALGLDSTRSVLAMQLAGIFLGLVAFVLLEAPVLGANLAFGTIVGLGLVLVFWLERRGTMNDDALT